MTLINVLLLETCRSKGNNVQAKSEGGGGGSHLKLAVNAYLIQVLYSDSVNQSEDVLKFTKFFLAQGLHVGRSCRKPDGKGK